MMQWLRDMLSMEDEEDRIARERARHKLDSGQISLTEIQVKVEKISQDAQYFKRSNKANHYRDRIAAYYRGA